jgi:hypothetical protein
MVEESMMSNELTSAIIGWAFTAVLFVSWVHAIIDRDQWRNGCLHYEELRDNLVSEVISLLKDAARTKPAATERQEPRE